MQIDKPANVKTRNRYARAELKWSINFRGKWTGRFSRAQRFVDSEVLRRCEPYIPLLTGTLIRSGILGTHIGSGRVQWITPYARRQYFRGRRPGTSNTGPLRGRYWFHRMKDAHGKQIIAGAKRLAGGA